MWLGDNKTKISFPHCWKMHSWETLVLKIFRGACPRTPLDVQAFGPQFYGVPAYSQASALILQKLMKTLTLYPDFID